MRILHLLSQTELTGAEVYAQNLIAAQIAQGHKVFVISDKIHVSMQAPFLALSVSTSRFWLRMKNILFLREFLKKNEIQVIHCHSRGAARHAFWARGFLPPALVTTLHGRQHFSWSKRFLNIYGEILVAVCENIKLAHQRSFGPNAGLIRVIPNPLSLTKKNSTTAPVPSKDRLAKNPLASGLPCRLALLGRSSGPKGQRIESIGFTCFEAWLQALPNLTISIMAPQPERFSRNFQIHVASLNARYPDRLKILGQIANLRAQLSNYDLNICSGRIAIESLLEHTPVMACGEFGFHGLVNEKNWIQASASNFGDIGVDSMSAPIPLDEVKKQILEFFSKPMPTPSENQNLADRAAQEFDEKHIQAQILEIYKAAIFKRNVRRWIPVLMYHKIPDQEIISRHRIFLVKSKFEKHLRFFRRKNFTTLTFEDLLEFWDLEKSYGLFPKKPLLLTFDDGYQDNLTNAQPLLKKYQMKATIFLLADHQILENSWDSDTGEEPQKLMTLDEKMKLDPEVFAIGSHGTHHIHLDQISPDLAQLEMQTAKMQLQKDLGSDPVVFAYPFGSTNSQLANLCFKAGYRFAVNTDQGGLELPDQPHSIFRVNIFPEDGPWQLWKKTAPWYRKYFFQKRRR